MDSLRIGLACVVCAVTAAWASGPVMHETSKLFPPDSASDQSFGCDLAMSGSIVVVGSAGDSQAANRCGAAYLFDTAGGLVYAKLVPDDGVRYDGFGKAVAINNTLVVVGSPDSDPMGDLSGSVYLFHADSGHLLAKILPNSGYDRLGASVAIDGDLLVAGAPFDGNQGWIIGCVYVYDVSIPESPVFLYRLLKPGGSMYDDRRGFGSTVAISGTRVLVGMPGENNENGIYAGSVYVFDISSPTGPVVLSRLLASDGRAGHRFGGRVAIHGNTAVVGAAQDDDFGFESGAAYIFDLSTPTLPVQVAKIHAHDARPNHVFGTSVAISGEAVIVGASGDDDLCIPPDEHNSGAAYLFDARTGAQISKLLASDGAAGDRLGCAVTIGEHVAVAGASYAAIEGVHSGAAYVFSLDTTPEPCNAADFAEPFGVLDGNDVAAFIGAFNAHDAAADLNGNGVFDLADVNLFAAVFVAGCP